MFIPLVLLVLLSPDGERTPPADPKRFKEDLFLLCNVEAKVGAKDPAKRAQKIALLLSAAKFGPDYEAFFSELSGMAPDEKPSFLLATARMAGLSACAFAGSSQGELVIAAKKSCAKKDADACDRLKALGALWDVAKKAQARK